MDYGQTLWNGTVCVCLLRSQSWALSTAKDLFNNAELALLGVPRPLYSSLNHRTKKEFYNPFVETLGLAVLRRQFGQESQESGVIV